MYRRNRTIGPRTTRDRHVSSAYMETPPAPSDPCRAIIAFAMLAAYVLSSLAVFLVECHSRRQYAAAVHGVRLQTAKAEITLLPVVVVMMVVLWVLCTQLL